MPDGQSKGISKPLRSININKLLWVIPSIVAFLIALIPTLTNQWPLTLDIFFHIRVAEVYSQYGFTLIDPLVNPPNGTPIDYPPLFSFLIVFLGSLFKINYFQVAKLIQPFMAFFAVLSVSYVAKKFYGDIAGISAGFLILSSYLFSRIVSPLPETLALIFVPLIVYLYYRSITSKNYKYALVASFLFLIIILTHQETTLLIFAIITIITLILGIINIKNIFKGNKTLIKSYISFIAVPLVITISVYVLALIVNPNFVIKLMTIMTGYITVLQFSDPISNYKYLAYLGIVLIFAIIGSVVALKRRDCKDIFIITWIILIFLVSKSYYFGINVYTIRLLIHLLIPLSIIGGYGLSYLYLDYKKTEFPSKTIRTIFLITILIISTLFAVSTVTVTNFQTTPNYNTQPFGSTEMTIPQIAPPTNSDTDLSTWFNTYGDKKSVVVSNNYETNKFLLTLTGQPIADVLSSEHIIMWGFRTSEIAEKNIGYFVLDKRLNFSSNSSKVVSKGAFIYFNTNYNTTSILPSNIKLIYENQDYKVFRVT